MGGVTGKLGGNLRGIEDAIKKPPARVSYGKQSTGLFSYFPALADATKTLGALPPFSAAASGDAAQWAAPITDRRGSGDQALNGAHWAPAPCAPFAALFHRLRRLRPWSSAPHPLLGCRLGRPLGNVPPGRSGLLKKFDQNFYSASRFSSSSSVLSLLHSSNSRSPSWCNWAISSLNWVTRS